MAERADELLAERGQAALPAGVTAHKLRHTFASILAALNEPMPYVMAQLGHSDPGFTMKVYAHEMRRGEGEREELATLVRGSAEAPEALVVEAGGAGMAISGTNTSTHEPR